MPFQPGMSGNPGGRVKGSCGGRALALAAMDRMLAKSKNKAKLEREMDDLFPLASHRLPHGREKS